jgi:hypothetical protein
MRLALFVIVCARVAWADGAAPPADPGELTALSGSWKCNGQETQPGGTPVAYKSTLTIGKGKPWLELAYKRPKDKLNPAYTGKGWMGWDAVTKQYLFVMVDNWGGHFEMRAATGDGKHFMFTGDASVIGRKLAMRYTFDLSGEGKKVELDTTALVNIGGSWKPVDVEVCRR